MTFFEKNAWACLVSLMVVFIPYFIFVFLNPVAFVGLFILAVVLISVLMTVFHIVNAVATPQIRKTGDTPRADERDTQIELWSSKIAGIVLAVAVVFWCIGGMFGISFEAISGVSKSTNPVNSLNDLTIPAVKSLLGVHILFAGFVFANVVYYASMIVGYRRAG